MSSIDRETARRILDLPLEPNNDAGVKTVREYLTALLMKVWSEQEAFGGKRPFGNSGWPFDLYIPLVKAGLIAGSFDEDGYADIIDTSTGDFLIQAAITELGRPA